MFKGKAKKDMTPKELATKNKEPWVSVLTTHVDKANPKNGFFELDWNEYFGIFVNLNKGSENGFLGDNIEFVSEFQASLNIIEIKLDEISDQIEVVDEKIDSNFNDDEVSTQTKLEF